MMEMTREHLARELIRGLQRQGIGESVHLRGSLARGQGDAMSDIDIGIRDDQRSDQTMAALVIGHLKRSYDVLFYDWATNLLPDACVLTFVLKDLPLFWQVDIELMVNPGKRVLTRNRVEHNWRDHLLKLWIMTAKHVARGTAGADEEVDRLYRRAVIDGNEAIDRAGKLAAALEAIARDAPAAYTGLIEQGRAFQRTVAGRDR